MATELTNIVTTISQGSNAIELNMDCPEYLSDLTWMLYNNMNIGVNLYNLDTTNDIGGICSDVCNADSTQSKLKDLTWTAGDSLNTFVPPAPEPEPVWGGPAPTLTSNQCSEVCSECREFWYSNAP